MTSQLRGVIGSLEERITERTEQLNVSAEVARAVSSILDPDELLQRVTLLIVERFNLYYAAAFLVDDDAKFAVLREATGEAGRVLKERSHQLEITGPSMVGRAIVTRQPCIVQDVDQETVRFANPLLTETKSEVALPLIIGDQPIGALDVQSTRAAAFDESTVLVLQGLADQIAIAVNNARQYQAAQSEAHQATLLFEASHLGSFIGENLIDVVHRLLDRTMAETNFDSWLAATYDPEADAMQVIAINDIGAPNADVPINEVQHLSELENDPLTMAIHSRQPVVIADPENDPRVAHVPLVMRKE